MWRIGILLHLGSSLDVHANAAPVMDKIKAKCEAAFEVQVELTQAQGNFLCDEY